MSTIHLSLEFSGAILPIVDGEDGKPRVPFKPIVEAIGADWMTQYRRVTQGSYLGRRLGICVGLMPYAGQTREMVLIRLDRVAAYLNSLNPEHIRSAGNADSADFLEAKHQEWDNVIHQHEMSFGVMAGSGKGNVRNQRLHDYISVCRELRLTNDADSRSTLKTLADELADQLGVGHISAKRDDRQPDLFKDQS